MTKPKSLVTGGAGFLGSHLCDYLIAKGHAVICVDNMVTGGDNNIKHLLQNKDFTFISHDVSKPIDVAGGLSYVWHLACPASPIDYQKIPIETLMAGGFGAYYTLMLAKEKGARYLLASTSECYGDPEVSPQPEDYWGHVNPVGLRSCYDEAKRFAEAMTMAFHRVHNVKTRIVRIFNSILADEPVVVFNDTNFHLEEIGKYADGLEGGIKHKIIVPSFDPKTCKVSLREVSSVIKHPCVSDSYELSLAYGRKIKVTGDHSVFTCDSELRPVAIPVRNLKKGNYVAIPSKLPVLEKDVTEIDIAEALFKDSESELWDYCAQSAALKSVIAKNKDRIYKALQESNRYKYGRREFFNIYKNRFLRQGLLPLYLIKKMKVKIPFGARIRMYKSGAHISLPSKIKVTNGILWLIGFYLAEGSSNYSEGKSYFLNFSSDSAFLKKAKSILENEFGVHVIPYKYGASGVPAIFTHSKLLYLVFDRIFQVMKDKKSGDLRIPPWVFQLPLSRLKHVLEGYRQGDGTHSGKKVGNELCFDTASKKLALDLTMLLLRFGLVASFGEYKTKFKKKYGNREFTFYRLTLCELSTFNVLEWDRGVKQKLLARRTGDLVWAWIKDIKRCPPTKYVYDFSVPMAENFVAGNGVCCHNTYGPRMRANDGRVVPTFINQALKNQPITVFGNGEQTRSFCYVSDLIEGIYRLMMSDEVYPTNIGNPAEMNMLNFAKVIIEITGSSSTITFKPLPADDPKQRRPDITKAKRVLGWEPKVSLREGLEKTIAYFK